MQHVAHVILIVIGSNSLKHVQFISGLMLTRANFKLAFISPKRVVSFRDKRNPKTSPKSDELEPESERTPEIPIVFLLDQID